MAKKSLFAEDKDGRLFVVLSAVMNPLCAMIDGLPITFFGKGKTAYLEIDVAIEWVKNEMQFHSPDKYAKILQVLDRVKRRENVQAVG